MQKHPLVSLNNRQRQPPREVRDLRRTNLKSGAKRTNNTRAAIDPTLAGHQFAFGGTAQAVETQVARTFTFASNAVPRIIGRLTAQWRQFQEGPLGTGPRRRIPFVPGDNPNQPKSTPTLRTATLIHATYPFNTAQDSTHYQYQPSHLLSLLHTASPTITTGIRKFPKSHNISVANTSNSQYRNSNTHTQLTSLAHANHTNHLPMAPPHNQHNQPLFVWSAVDKYTQATYGSNNTHTQVASCTRLQNPQAINHPAQSTITHRHHGQQAQLPQLCPWGCPSEDMEPLAIPDLQSMFTLHDRPQASSEVRAPDRSKELPNWHNPASTHYPYIHDLLNLQSCQPCQPTPVIPASAQCIITPLQVHQWALALRDHPDPRFVQYILEGISSGFRIGYQHATSRCKSARSNLFSATQHPAPVQAYLDEECTAGRVAGPFAPDEVRGLQVSRFGVIPKSNQPGKWRLILDLSFPHGHSVNDGILREWCSMQYATVDQAVAHILQMGSGALLAKIDIEHAYRNVPVHPDDRHLLGMRWNNELFIDTTLPFGLRSAPKVFCAIADALEWILLHRGVTWSLHYIDDFLTVGRAGSLECAENLSRIQTVCAQLGVPLKAHKIEGPNSCLTFLGIEINTVRGEISLPRRKVEELEELIAQWEHRRACKKRTLLSLIGKLAHACKVVTPGRTFLRRMIDTSCKARHPDHWVKLKSEFCSDLAWWKCFLRSWNGRSLMDVHAPKAAPDVTFSSDASGSWGCGAIWDNRWLQCAWNGWWEEQSIAVKELLPIVLACAIWGPQWQHRQVLALCDNTSVVHIIRSRTSRDCTIMHLLRTLHFLCAIFDICLRCDHIPGIHNTYADAISRNSLQVLFAGRPSACHLPCSIPGALMSLLVYTQPDWLSPSWQQLLRTSLEAVWHRPPDAHTPRHRRVTSGSVDV